IGEDFGFALLRALAPSAKAPFEIPFPGNKSKSAVGKVEADLEAQAGGAGKSVTLGISDNRGRKIGEVLYEVTGTVTNTNSSRVTKPKVVATFYDSKGSVVGARDAFIDPEDMGPGQTGRFRITLPERNKLVSRYTLVAEGSTEPRAEFPTAPPAPTNP
ncbi:MAG: FxLYD domain-containing protein, partial [Candidatus Methylomirabilales bacterium]